MRKVRTYAGALALFAATGCSGGGSSPSIAPLPQSPASVHPVASSAPVALPSPAGAQRPGSSKRFTSSVSVGNITIVQIGRASTSGTATALGVQLAPPAPGNVLVASLAYGDGAQLSATPPQGWTAIDNIANPGNGAGEVQYYHVAASGESGSYTWTVSSPAGAVPLAVAAYEFSGVNASSPIAAHATGYARTGYSSSTPALSSGSGQLPVAFFAQYTGGQEPQYFNGVGNFAGMYTVAFAGADALAQETQFGTALSTGSTVQATQTWQGGDNSDQVAEILLLNPSGVASAPAPGPLATSAPAPAPTNVPVSASGPKHVRTMAFYKSDQNGGIPVSWMTSHVDMVETAEDPSYANAFMNAGGTYAMVYTDPHLVPGCSVPYPGSPGFCTGAMGNTTPESAWLHDASNRRLHSGNGQDALNPASGATQSAYANWTGQLTGGTRFNAVVMDDTAPQYRASDFQYDYNAIPAEVANQSDPQGYWFGGETALAASAAQPVVYNGGENDDSDHAFLTSRNVLGRMIEGCAVFGAFRVNDTQGNPLHLWAPTMNKLLAATSRGRYSICMNYAVNGGDPIGDRLYALGSFWLTYDPQYSVAFPDFATSDYAGGTSSRTFAEYQIVPTDPLQSPGTDVNTLRTGTGAYVREFRSCYQNGAFIGRCAAVVNPSYGSSVALPSFSASYNNSLTLDSRSWYNGGAIGWSSSVPSSLAPETGLILKQ